jgi:hypothetical protein
MANNLKLDINNAVLLAVPNLELLLGTCAGKNNFIKLVTL